MSVTYTYNNLATSWNRYASKGDTVQISVNGQGYNGVVESVNKNGIIVTIQNTKNQVEVSYGNYQIVERRYKNIGNIPIEVNDLVSYAADCTNYTGVIASIDGNAVALDIISHPKMGRQQSLVNKLSLIAKGFSLNPTAGMNVPMQQGNVASTAGGVNPQNATNVQGMPVQMATAQQPSQIALLYPAPCVVMAVPYNTNPDSFPEAMYVQMPDCPPGKPSLLPVVRMGCDTALVVVPPAKNRGQAAVTMAPVKTTPVRQNV